MQAFDFARAAVLCCVLGALAGCGGATVETKQSTATTGQQLMDIKKAYDEGIITKEEYERQRKLIMSQ
jgi:hypothetical protein